MKATLVCQNGQYVLSLEPENDREAAAAQALHADLIRKPDVQAQPYSYMSPRVVFLFTPRSQRD